MDLNITLSIFKEMNNQTLAKGPKNMLGMKLKIESYINISDTNRLYENAAGTSKSSTSFRLIAR